MTKTTKILSELSRLIDCVPFAHDGTGSSTASAGGAWSAMADLRKERAFVRGILNAIVETQVGIDDADSPITELGKFSEWIEKRKTENWR